MTESRPKSDGLALRLLVGGRVQGVGFRPFVYRLAKRHGLGGWVRNRKGEVEILVQGDAEALASFDRALLEEAPSLAKPEILSRSLAPAAAHPDFAILPSEADEAADIHVAPDYFLCDDCVAELLDPANRRYRYPFINCTQCGPRYTLIRKLPYDRSNTGMAGFELCPQCRAEYENPADRRFHAEPIACPECGPRLWFRTGAGSIVDDTPWALAACVAALREGGIVAVKGIGGYHLLCDARNDEAVLRLRENKPRPGKPLAVMFPAQEGLAMLRDCAAPDAVHEQLLRDPVRSIVLVPKKPDSVLSPYIAPGLNEIGAMLPYSPLHHLLLADFGAPLVATSANVSGEPVLIDGDEAERKLAHVAGAFLHHDRPIERPADDPLLRVIAGKPRPLRLGRGSAPLELRLPFKCPRPVLALGGQMRNTVALAWSDRVVVSPHIGDMATARSLEVFEQVAEDLQRLYGVAAEVLACDAHPDYAASRWARRTGLPLVEVFHHHAHASALAGEFPEVKQWQVFTWDGAGYGADGTLWGGEALLGRPGNWRRVATLRRFHIPGGEQAARAPWRSAAAVCWEAGMEWENEIADVALVHQAWQRKMNCFATTSAGRLFDAAAVLTGLIHRASFEGQAPMLLEAACEENAAAVSLPLARNANGLWESDWAQLLPLLVNVNLSVDSRAAIFHASMAQAVLEQARAVRDEHGVNVVGLSGGVFQNRVLTERAVELLQQDGFAVKLAECIPCNDAGLSFGQIIEACA